MGNPLVWLGVATVAVFIGIICFLAQPTAIPTVTLQDSTNLALSAKPSFPRGQLLRRSARAELRKQATNPGVSELVACLVSDIEPMPSRRKAAIELARMQSDEAIGGLMQAFKSAPSGLKAAIAEALGQCDLPEARHQLLTLLSDPDEAVVRGAIRALGVSGDPEVVEKLGLFLRDETKPVSIRTEAALALGNISDATSFGVLTTALPKTADEVVAVHILEALGRRSFSETGEFFAAYLQSPEADNNLRVSALEALGYAHGEVAPLLVGFLGDTDSRVRAAAAWALSVTENPGAIGDQLVKSLGDESAPDVRRRLYQALARQTQVDWVSVNGLLQKETEADVRLDAFAALAASCRRASSPELVNFFDQSAVPELTKSALQGTSLQLRLSSVVALQAAKTPQALQALKMIAQKTTDSRVAEAARAAASQRP